MKNDAGKTEYHHIPPRALKALADILTFGARKYAPNSWKNVEAVRYVDALYRHLEKVRMGESIDEDGFHHLAAVAANAMFLLEKSYDQKAQDDITFGKEIDKEVPEGIEEGSGRVAVGDGTGGFWITTTKI